MKVSDNEWTLKLKALYSEADQIRATGLYAKIMAHCESSARLLRAQAGSAATDRDMNRLHGKADAYADMLMVLNDVVASYAATYTKEMEDDAFDNDGGTGADGAGEQGDSLPDTPTFKDRKRLIYAAVRDEAD